MNIKNSKKILRMDDIGASTKYWEIYGNGKITFKKYTLHLPIITNFFFLKYLPCFKSWGKYEELTKKEWEEILTVLKKYNRKLLVGVTANWIEKDGTPIPFPIKFPQQAAILKEAQEAGFVEIANHGFSHCVIGKHLPRLLSSNRRYHREFWPYLSQETHTKHILESQKILEDYFERPITTLIPPGNIWSIKTYEAAKKTNIQKIICNQYMLDSEKQLNKIDFISDVNDYFNFHDREIKLYGIKWLENFKKNV